MLSGKDTAAECLSSELKMDSYPLPLCSVVTFDNGSNRVTPQHIRDWLISLPEDSPVSHFPLPGCDLELMTPEICGQPLSRAYASFDQSSHCWRTFQASLLTGILEPFSGTWPRRGTMQNGMCFRLASREHHIHGKGCSLLPTPKASDAMGGSSAEMGRRALAKEKRRSGHSIERRIRDVVKYLYGINPSARLYEWMMGFPESWTGLKPLETHKFHSWLQQHGRR